MNESKPLVHFNPRKYVSILRTIKRGHFHVLGGPNKFYFKTEWTPVVGALDGTVAYGTLLQNTPIAVNVIHRIADSVKDYP